MRSRAQWLLVAVAWIGAASAPALASTRMDVVVRVRSLADATLDVRARVDDWPGPELILRTVPAYLDNPTAEPDGEIVSGLVVRDAKGSEVSLRAVELEGGERGWRADGVRGAFELRYTLRARYVAGQQVRDYSIRLPFVDRQRAWLTGNHVFVAPEREGPRWFSLRAPMPVTLRFELPEGLQLAGPPSPVSLPNLFCLLSLQFGFGRFEVLRGKDATWPWAVILDEGGHFTAAEKELLARRTAQMTARAAALFGGIPFEQTALHVFRHPGLGGLEGAFAAQAYAPDSVDLSSVVDPNAAVFYAVALHEFVHTWLPIALFSIDDAWLKEGMTSYYGNVLAARAGWLEPSAVEDLFDGYETTVFGDVTLERVPLSDPRLWWREYDGENWRRITYDRGAAVALMLDVLVRERSDNHHSLDDVMKVLYARHLHGAFDRDDLMSAIDDATGVDVRGFFARYVDGTSPPTPSEVRRTHRRALELGVYRIGRADASFTETD